jgi:hypothetical protein
MAEVMNAVWAMAALAGRVLVALVFLQAAIGKLRSWRALEGVIANYRIVPAGLARPAALALPPVELGLASALLVSDDTSIRVIASLLLLVFAAAMGVNLLRGRREIDCGCFQSDLRQSLGWTLVARNLVLAALAGLPTSSLTPVLMLQAYAAGLVLFIAYAALDTLAATGPRLRAWAYPEAARP